MAKTIQWFPGHMKKAMRDMEEKRDLCDGVICVLDARAPIATYNKKLPEIFRGKPVLYVLNKSDLADGKAEKFATEIEKQGKTCVLLSAVNGAAKRVLEKRLQILTKEKRERAESKGVNRRFRYTVIGIPNTGKSKIVNLLGGAKRAKTGDIAGVTRDVRWIKCADFDLLDTPGTMPPSCETQYLARHLAYIGSLNDDILDITDIALELLKELAANYPSALTERYGIEDFSEGETENEAALKMYETVCRRRGFMLRGGDFDYERGARAILDDFRKGRLGRICLENAEDFQNVRF